MQHRDIDGICLENMQLPWELAAPRAGGQGACMNCIPRPWLMYSCIARGSHLTSSRNSPIVFEMPPNKDHSVHCMKGKVIFPMVSSTCCCSNLVD